MIPPSTAFNLLLILLVVISVTGCERLTGKSLRGSINLDAEQTTSTLPKQTPKTVYVADFTLDEVNFTADQGVRGAVPGVVTGMSRTAVGQLGGNLPQPFATTNPAVKTQSLVDLMATSLVGDLASQGIPAQRLPKGPLPTTGWLISGQFVEVDEGNRFRRAALGFGQGASQMEVHVGISDMSSTRPSEPFVTFGTTKEAGKTPGAVAAMNPYAAAARFVMEKNASEKDTRSTATQIANELLKYRTEVLARSQVH